MPNAAGASKPATPHRRAVPSMIRPLAFVTCETGTRGGSGMPMTVKAIAPRNAAKPRMASCPAYGRHEGEAAAAPTTLLIAPPLARQRGTEAALGGREDVGGIAERRDALSGDDEGKRDAGRETALLHRAGSSNAMAATMRALATYVASSQERRSPSGPRL